MQTTVAVNISLPIRLKQQAEGLVSGGYFVSFSDLARSALRNILQYSPYDILLQEVKEEERRGESVILDSDADIDAFMAKV